MRLPAIAAAMHRGELSYSKVRALTRVATAATEAELLVFAKAGTASHVEALVRSWRRADRLAEMEAEQRRFTSRHLRLHADEDGMVVVQARLAPEAGAALLQALDAAAERLREGSGTADDATAEQRRADALALVAESALAAGFDPGTRGDRYQVVLHVDAEALAVDGAGAATLDGHRNVPAETSRRLACDAALVVMRHGADGRALDVGRRTRVVSTPLRRALAHRDRGCRFPGCGARLCDAHHVEHWADGGATTLENLVLLCRRHHRAVHEEGFRVEATGRGEVRFFRPDGRRLEFFRPDGRRLETAPASPRLLVAGDTEPGAMLPVTRDAIDPAAGLPSWDGGPVDVAWAVDYLRPRAAAPFA